MQNRIQCTRVHTQRRAAQHNKHIITFIPFQLKPIYKRFHTIQYRSNSNRDREKNKTCTSYGCSECPAEEHVHQLQTTALYHIILIDHSTSQPTHDQTDPSPQEEERLRLRD